MDHLTRWDVFVGCLGAVTPLLAVFLAAHWQNRSDKKKWDEKFRNQLAEYSLHTHVEYTPYAKPTDVLTVEGLRFPRNGSK